MKTLRIVSSALAVACLFAAIVCHAGAPAKRKGVKAKMADDVTTVLSSSRDSNALYAAAIGLVKSPHSGDHATLLSFLSQEGFLGRLDSEKEYQGRTSHLRIARVLKALRESPSESARLILVRLTQQKGFTANGSRADLLINAVVDFRPPPEPVIAFWDAHCRPEDGFMNLTVQALVANGDEAAIALLERKLADTRFEDDERIWWMHTAVLTHRNDPPLLRACERLLSKGLEPGMRPHLVESLFDYQPMAWHGPDEGYPPPPPENASPEARTLLARIGDYALANVTLSRAQKAVVEKGIKAIREAK